MNGKNTEKIIYATLFLNPLVAGLVGYFFNLLLYGSNTGADWGGGILFVYGVFISFLSVILGTLLFYILRNKHSDYKHIGFFILPAVFYVMLFAVIIFTIANTF